MKFLLTAINAKYIHSNPAIYSLRAFAGEELQKHVELAEYTINQQFADILADIYKRKPDVIGFSCYIWNISMVLDIIPELHKIMPQLPIWLGGPEVSFDAPELLKKYPMVTGVMIGEGEETFRELLRYYVESAGARSLRIMAAEKTESGKQESWQPENGKLENEKQESGIWKYDFHSIPGLCLQDGYTLPRDPVDMSTIPFLYSSLEAFANKIIYYESSRGCPFRCSYCLSSIEERVPMDEKAPTEEKASMDENEPPSVNSENAEHSRRRWQQDSNTLSRKRVRLRNLDIVKKELQFFLDNQVRQVKFVDRTFNCNHEHAMGIWRYIQEHDNGVTNFHFEVSADILNEEEIALLNQMRPGLAQLEIGVQSTNPDTIKAINRTMNVEKLEKIVSAINAGHNVHQHLDLIAGLPYEEYETFAKSFDRVYAMEPEQLQLGFLKVLKGSLMYDKAEEYGICYLEKPPYEVLYTRWLPYEDVLRLKRIEEMVELYYNSNQFRFTLAFLVKQFESPFAMFEKLASFYERKGYFINSPARAYRYQVLLEFALEQIGVREDGEKEGSETGGNWRSEIGGNSQFEAGEKERSEIGGNSQSEVGEHKRYEAAGLALCSSNGGEKEAYAEIYRELLTYDMYLRENLKSRPDFAKDPAPYKEQIRHFYEKEAQERKYLPDYEAYDHKQLAKMTHMEPFRYPVWEKDLWKRVQKVRESLDFRGRVHSGKSSIFQRTGDCESKLMYVVFDYAHRDPLTSDARTVCLPQAKLEEAES